MVIFIFNRVCKSIVSFLCILNVSLLSGGNLILRGRVYAFESSLVSRSYNSDSIEILIIILLGILGIFLGRTVTMKKPTPSKEIGDRDEWRELASATGYLYDEKQDIFYTKLDAWQRDMGYCRLYDEACAPLNLIIDSEPIYFEYNNKRWLIQFWKGQYGMALGCEIGIYNTEGPDIDIPGLFNGTFFHAVEDDEMLQISLSLEKEGRILFCRRGRHWWHTGFMVGDFAQPWELIMHMDITFPNNEMRDAFVSGLKIRGYKDNEIKIKDDRVLLKFDQPYSEQPISRVKITDSVIQSKNRFLCDKYLKLTSDYETFPEKMYILQEKYPELYHAALTLGKPVLLFESFDVIKKHINKVKG